MTTLQHLLDMILSVLLLFVGVGVAIVVCGLVWSLATDKD